MDINAIMQQAEAAASHGEHLSRERDAYLYQCALDRGDMDTLAVILERAQYDPALEHILNDIHQAEMDEAEEVSEEDWQRMMETLQKVLKQYGYGEET